ncbi:undecaprenyl-diphosphate phosphatase [uncultured Hoeflea sp.]|uniref:undecaprenyl-diphosphate phosphatase n=1 Tax=uncultured Hoeflea sp. TaxID=538666 RepID=UPI00263A3774|nr:undecaprenyl-diphosphate phosphatase [uncultured Hoeflea sp.]
MNETTLVGAALLGLIEGLTEFIPVSSTAHLLLAGHFLGFSSPGNSFEVLVQLGAILAILSVYFARLWTLVTDLPSSARARRFVAAILLAFAPAAVIGGLAHGFIKTVLFESMTLICVVLIIGGFVLLVIDRMPLRPKHTNVMDYPLSLAFKIGLIQCLAMVPGTSRSGATIAGALLLGADKRSAAEFSFFLAMPTMVGAFTLDLYKNYDKLAANDIAAIVVGFIMAFIAGVIVVRSLLDFVSRHGFAPFAWWRIAVGTLGLIGLWAF